MILAIETSDILCSLAFWDNGRTVLEYNLEMPQQHATLVGSLVEQGLAFLAAPERKRVYTMQDLDLVTVSIGPGSFTGLRIGLSFAQGFCAGRGLPICGISNHQILAAQSAACDRPIYTIIEARRNEVYLAAHKMLTANLSQIESHNIRAKDTLADDIPEGAQLVTAQGIKLADSVWQALNEKDVIVLNRARFTAGRLALLGMEKYKRDGADNLADLEPMYIRPFAGAS